ncbi:MAG TPA: hypothetical protein VHY91_23215 [Pirellulales bacterium]|jgi:hypothetical protein|nr:hypothetical protein [Pirellulales bacterium]
MHPPNRRRIVRWVIAVALGAPVLALGASYFGLFAWSRINCSIQSVDITTGRLRDIRYVFWLPVHCQIHDSRLTAALRPEDLAGKVADWHPVNTLSPGIQHSPHHAFHLATWQIRELELLWGLGHFGPSLRRASALRVLALWQQSGNYREAGSYLQALNNLLTSAAHDHHTVDEADLQTLAK